MKKVDLVGNRFGRLLVISKSNLLDAGKSVWNCVCDCGKEKQVRGTHLTGGKVISCGCSRLEKTKARSTTHGMSKTRAYRIWRNMINRCHWDKWPEWHLYGGRGITVCDEWRESFERFYSDMGAPMPNLSIDRIDNSKGYSKENCRWATAKEQASNRRNAEAA